MKTNSGLITYERSIDAMAEPSLFELRRSDLFLIGLSILSKAPEGRPVCYKTTQHFNLQSIQTNTFHRIQSQIFLKVQDIHS